jgi:hypothetical protein
MPFKSKDKFTKKRQRSFRWADEPEDMNEMPKQANKMHEIMEKKKKKKGK